jgi:hypothetical protein
MHSTTSHLKQQNISALRYLLMLSSRSIVALILSNLWECEDPKRFQRPIIARAWSKFLQKRRSFRYRNNAYPYVHFPIHSFPNFEVSNGNHMPSLVIDFAMHSLFVINYEHFPCLHGVGSKDDMIKVCNSTSNKHWAARSVRVSFDYRPTLFTHGNQIGTVLASSWKLKVDDSEPIETRRRSVSTRITCDQESSLPSNSLRRSSWTRHSTTDGVIEHPYQWTTFRISGSK